MLLQLFISTYGSLSSAGDKIAPRVLAAFMAVSSLGNYFFIFSLNTYDDHSAIG